MKISIVYWNSFKVNKSLAQVLTALFCCFIFCISSHSLYAQVASDSTDSKLPDSLTVKKIRSFNAKTALKHSAVLPGWGQTYNQRYYKSPIMLGGVGVGLGASVFTATQTGKYKKALTLRLDGDSATLDRFEGTFSTNQLLRLRNKNRHYNNAAIFGTLFVYSFNMLDAYTDAVMKRRKGEHVATKAIWYGMLIPGGGQMYNKKYWKLPLVYGGMGAACYLIAENTRKYESFKNAYILRTDDDPTTFDRYHNDPIFADNPNFLANERDRYKGNLDRAYLIAVGVYLISLVDAVVDAHLYSFDTSDDLSLKVRPGIGLQQTALGVTQQFNLKITF